MNTAAQDTSPNKGVDTSVRHGHTSPSCPAPQCAGQLASLWRRLLVRLRCLHVLMELQVTSGTARDNKFAHVWPTFSFPREQRLVAAHPPLAQPQAIPCYLYASLGEVCPHG